MDNQIKPQDLNSWNKPIYLMLLFCNNGNFMEFELQTVTFSFSA